MKRPGGDLEPRPLPWWARPANIPATGRSLTLCLCAWVGFVWWLI